MNNPPSEEQWNDLFRTIGFIVFQWAFIEHLMDDCIILSYHVYDGKRFPDEIPRTQLSRKISLLKKYFKKLPMLYRFKNDLLPLIDRIDKLSNDRHWFIHGVIAHFSPTHLHLSKYNYGNEYHKIDVTGYNITDLRDYGNKIQGLATELGNFVQRFVKEAALSQQTSQP